MKIENIRIEYKDKPIGLDVKKPRFSWQIISDKQNVFQMSYRILVMLDTKVVWDTGRVESDQSILIEYAGDELTQKSHYKVYVEISDNTGNTSTAETFFETGLLNGLNIKADWITHSFPDEETATPIFIKEFTTDSDVEHVRVYATALGVYEIKINDHKLDNSHFAPGWTNYHKRLQYQTYKADNLLHEDNKIEITVGNGWYKGIFGFTCTPNHYGDRVAALAEIHITYKDGKTEIIKTDHTWKVGTGHIRYSEIYMGETIDTTFNDDNWQDVVLTSYDKEKIFAQENESVCVTEKLKAKKLIVTPKGEKVIDFGQILTGFVEVEYTGAFGQEIVIEHAETLDKDGNFYPETLRQAKSIDRYICNGGEQIFTPHFTFHGFRYIRIKGMKDIDISKFNGLVLHTRMDKTGEFTTSNPLVNQLQKNIEWSQKGNFLDIPTDCNQRDERLGWTGDAQVFAGTATFNYNVASFFTKWLHDLASEQTKEYGVPHVVPNILGDQEGAAAWSDAAVIIPWVMYERFGDIRILEEQYESMKGWIDYITAKTGENGLWQTGFQYGDWLALDKEESADRTGATDVYLVANAYYAYSTNILQKVASILGNFDDSIHYKNLYEEIKTNFNNEFITKTGRVVSETQTGCLLTLHFDLAEEPYRERILDSLITNISNHKNHLSTGFVGTPYLCHTLSENSKHDLAGTLFLKEDYPSWLYAVKKGATTIWERWNSILPNGDFESSGMNSLNHYANGSIGDWMYQTLAGINPLEPGYKRLMIRPQFIKGITSVQAKYTSMYGDIRSSWWCDQGRIKVEVEVPANTTAILHLPEKDKPIELGSGFYQFEYETETDLSTERFTMDSTLKEVLDEPLAVHILNQYSPDMLDSPMIEFAYNFTISELIAKAPAEGEVLFKMVIDELNKVTNNIK